MEFASDVHKAAINARKIKMRAFAEGDLQREINVAKNKGKEFIEIDVPSIIDLNMLNSYVMQFGYVVEIDDRTMTIRWNKPTK